jgi:hypothetical protein
MHDPIGDQFALNSASRDCWHTFADHRRKVMNLLVAGGDSAASRLCVVGAGNCNDLDLISLLEAHREVHLVDLDSEALAAGIARQGVADHHSLRTYGGVDVTSMLDKIATWSPRTKIGPEDRAACADEPVRRAGTLLPGPFDSVASTCVLSQLMYGVVSAVSEAHPQFVELLQATRAGHLRLLAHLAAPGGSVTLITDVVSSETLPSLGTIPDASLDGLLVQIARDRNFFHGVNPAALSSVVVQDPVLNAELAGQETVPPWRWDIGPRLYLVMALRWRKCA